MNGMSSLKGILTAACFMTLGILLPSTGNAQADSRVATSMASLKAMATKLGAPKLEGKEVVGAKMLPPCILARPRSTTISIWSTPLARKMARG